LYYREVIALEYMTAKRASEIWGISNRRVQALCENGQIPDVTRLANAWAIPKSTQKKTIDGRTKAGKIEKVKSAKSLDVR
jgi:predicted site-specific integrase-resolvase